MRSNKGISLIVLVITIITVTILFGIILGGLHQDTTYELERNQYCPTCGRRY